jgi:hypothetical protein
MNLHPTQPATAAAIMVTHLGLPIALFRFLLVDVLSTSRFRDAIPKPKDCV